MSETAVAATLFSLCSDDKGPHHTKLMRIHDNVHRNFIFQFWRESKLFPMIDKAIFIMYIREIEDLVLAC